MPTTLEQIKKDAVRTPLSIQAIMGGSNSVARSDESVDSSETALGGVSIPADTLSTRVDIPNLTPTPSPDNFQSQLAKIQTQALDIQDQLQVQPETDQLSPKDQIQGGILDLLNKDTAGAKQDIRDSNLLKEKGELSRQLLNDITRARRSFEAQIRDLKKNPDGKLRGALQDEINDRTEQANLILSEKAFQYSIVNGDFQAAQQIAEQQIADMESADNRRLQILKTAYDFVQNDLTESEKLQIQQNFSQQQAERESERRIFEKKFEYELNAPQRAFENQIAQGQLNVAIQKLNNDRLSALSGSIEQQQKQKAALEGRASTAEIVINKVDEALGQTGTFGSTGFLGGTTQKVPGSPSFNLAQTVQTIKANLGFAELQQMRANSPTGGALGQVAVQELEALQSTISNLSVGQSQEQLEANLLKVRGHYEAWLETVGYNVAPDGQVIKIIE